MLWWVALLIKAKISSGNLNPVPSPEDAVDDGHSHAVDVYGDCDENTFSVDVIPHSERHEHGQSVPEREDALPQLLSETGLYSNISTKDIHPAMQFYTPRYQLWSDGADKSRWIYIPECGRINTANMNDWDFPVGTRFFKEFSIDGVRVETRIIERLGVGPEILHLPVISGTQIRLRQ